MTPGSIEARQRFPLRPLRRGHPRIRFLPSQHVLRKALGLTQAPVLPPGGPHRPSLRSCSEYTFVRAPTDRKSTRLNSSHVEISYAVFCLKKKKQNRKTTPSI